jgi:hypothetical protein
MPQRSSPTLDAAIASPLPPDFRSKLVKVNRQRFTAAGHATGRFDADLYVTPLANGDTFGLGRKIDPGTVLVMDHTLHGTSAAGPILMMEKRPPGFDPTRGDWRYVVVDGESVSDGPLDSCASCHGEAPHDHVFPID